MTNLYPILIVIAPLFAAIFVAIASRVAPKYCFPGAVIGSVISFFSAAKAMIYVGGTGNEIQYQLGGWAPPIGIEYRIDHLNAIILVLVTFVALLTLVYAKRSIEQEIPHKVNFYYVLFLLLNTGLLGMTITGDAFNLYVLLEVAALSSYGLMALGKGRAVLATFHYLIMGTIGACLYLLGVGYLLLRAGSLNMIELSGILTGLYQSDAILIAFSLIIVGVWLKMAFFPLHGWLPNAYSYAPTATTCLVAPLMTKVSVYIMIRMMFSVFSYEYIFNVLVWQNAVVILASIAIVAGSLYALSQNRLKKMLTFLIVSEIGYMVGGVWLGNANGITGATYHILADGLMTLCLFMAIGCIIYKEGSDSFVSMRGKFRQMPITMVCFVVGAFSMIGIPPTCGFFSKWYLISGGIDAGAWHFIVALLFSSLINAVLFFRLIEIAFFLEGDKPPKKDEAPRTMLAPLMVVSVAILLLGIFTNNVVQMFITHVVPSSI